jgi:hypothetical protein
MPPSRWARSFRTLGAIAATALGVAGCGPVESTSLLIDADVQLEAARAAGAAKTAPYEFTSAESYLHKAREEVAYSNYEPAIRFARKAVEHAKAAKDKAINATNKPAEMP